MKYSKRKLVHRIMKKRKHLHYGWIMLAFCILSAFIYVGLCSNTVSLYVQPISDANGFPRGMFTIKNSIASVIIGGTSLMYGRITAKFRLKNILTVGSACIIVCYVIQIFSKTLPMFYLSALFQGIGFGLCSSTALHGCLPFSALPLPCWHKWCRILPTNTTISVAAPTRKDA